MNKITVREDSLNSEIIIKEDTVIHYNDCTCNVKFIIESNAKLFIYLENSKLTTDFNIKHNINLKSHNI